MALQRKKKVAAQLGIDVEELEKRGIDTVEMLRLQNQAMLELKEEKAQKMLAEKLAKECTFAPELNKPRIPKLAKKAEKKEPPRTSIGSINL